VLSANQSVLASVEGCNLEDYVLVSVGGRTKMIMSLDVLVVSGICLDVLCVWFARVLFTLYKLTT